MWEFEPYRWIHDTSLNVSYTYVYPGTYNVRLIVESQDCGITDYTQPIQVYPNEPPLLGGIYVTPVTGLTVRYGLRTAHNYDQIEWNLGDGNRVAGVISGAHTYASPGSYNITVRARNACDTASLNRLATVTSLLAGQATAHDWVLYPNPTRYELFLMHPTYQGEATIQIYDLTGRLLQTHTLSTYPARLSLALPSGLYTLRILTSEGPFIRKLLIE
jgi:hypothetical protein